MNQPAEMTRKNTFNYPEWIDETIIKHKFKNSEVVMDIGGEPDTCLALRRVDCMFDYDGIRYNVEIVAELSDKQVFIKAYEVEKIKIKIIKEKRVKREFKGF